MKLGFKSSKVLMILMIFGLALTGVFNTFARASGDAEPSEEHYVVLEDDGGAVTVRTNAKTVGEVLKRAGIILTEADVVNPGLEAEIEWDDFVISIWRARPVVVKDGIFEQYLMTTELDAREIAIKAGRDIYEEDEVARAESYDFLETGPAYVYEVTRNHVEPEEVELDLSSKLGVSPLTARRGVNQYMVTVNGRTVERKETYYDLPMGGVMAIAARECGVAAYYTVREDGVKVDAEGYVLVAADLARYPRCTVVETSLGLGKVYDTGSFALTNPEQFDLATDWTNHNGK
ncbi:ubiquitin-like domain-containing protein [Candidatus Saccharibacteria bacterium]|nr:ubiquitin-like domain-containing protein [Candidatus Saccharibacteria bacterium]